MASSSRTWRTSLITLVIAFVVVVLVCGYAPKVAYAATDDEPVDYPEVLTVESVGVSYFGGDQTVTLSEGGSVSVRIPRIVRADLVVEHSPNVIAVGIDCGMPGMCGIDPCLCGSSDHWGHCSCNGLRDVMPTVHAVSSDESVVRVEESDAGVKLVPAGEGKATITMTSSLENYEDVESRFEVEVGGLMAADMMVIAGACAVLVVVLVVCVLLARRRGNRVERASKMPLMVLALALVVPLGLGLSACGSAKVDASSPQVKSVSMKSSSTGTEASQRVEVKVEFDQQIVASSDVLADFAVTLNGKEIDSSLMKLSASPSATAVTFTLSPSDAAATGKGSVFAVYQGQISIGAKRSDGALPSIASASGSAAVLREPVTGLLSSGLAIEIESQTAGSAADNTLAQTTFRVTSPAMVRAITWFSPDGGATKVLKHNHNFLSNDASACAEDLAKAINTASCGVTASARGDEVTLRAVEIRDGQTLEPVVIEGAGATPGAFDASMVASA